MIAYLTKRGIARSYWHVKIFNPTSWWRVLSGKGHYRRILTAVGAQLKNMLAPRKPLAATAHHEAEALRMLTKRGVRLLLIYNEGADVLDYLQFTLGDAVQQLSVAGTLRLEIIPQASHTFLLLRHQDHLRELVCHWARSLYGKWREDSHLQ